VVTNTAGQSLIVASLELRVIWEGPQIL
jgi:hypothetical protein